MFFNLDKWGGPIIGFTQHLKAAVEWGLRSLSHGTVENYYYGPHLETRRLGLLYVVSTLQKRKNRSSPLWAAIPFLGRTLSSPALMSRGCYQHPRFYFLI